MRGWIVTTMQLSNVLSSHVRSIFLLSEGNVHILWNTYTISLSTQGGVGPLFIANLNDVCGSPWNQTPFIQEIYRKKQMYMYLIAG